MKLRILFILIFSNFLSAQTGLFNAEKPEDISKNIDLEKTDMLNYFSVGENDVLWSKVVYEYIDLNEKLNFPLLFPIDDDKNIIGRKLCHYHVAITYYCGSSHACFFVANSSACSFEDPFPSLLSVFSIKRENMQIGLLRSA